MLTHKSYQRPIHAPHDILNRRAVHLRDGFLLLNVVQDDRRGGAEYKTGCTPVEDLVRLDGRFYAFDDGVR
jgi:ATP sulfurylase